MTIGFHRMTINSRKDFFIPLITVIADVLTIEASFLFSYWLRFLPTFTQVIPLTYGIPPLKDYIYSSLVMIPVWILLFQNKKLYRPRRGSSFSDEFFSIVRIIILGMVVVMAGSFFYRAFSYSRVVFAIITFTTILFVTLSRAAITKFERWWYSIGHDLNRVLVVGTSTVARNVFQSLRSNRSLGYDAIGYCSMDGNSDPTMLEIPCMGSIATVPDLITFHKVDVVLIALNDEEHSSLSQLVRDCQGLNVEMMMIPDILELMTSLVQIKHIHGVPFLGIKSPSLSTWNTIIKRTFDLIFASVIIALASPLYIFIALLIKLDSRGPIFYYQDRIGLDGEVFRVLKFRSMRTDAEQTTGPVWSKKDDPRTTHLGKFLRRFSLDELPQFFNVLIGDMSIVGPRPERPHFVEQFKKQIPRYPERHRVKTGMTGWAQVNGLRGNASITERTKYDIYYIENWSLIFDLKIIFKTIHAVLFGKDAY